MENQVREEIDKGFEGEELGGCAENVEGSAAEIIERPRQNA